MLPRMCFILLFVFWFDFFTNLLAGKFDILGTLLPVMGTHLSCLLFLACLLSPLPLQCLLLPVSSRSWCHYICSSHDAFSGSWWLVCPSDNVLPPDTWFQNWAICCSEGRLAAAVVLSPQCWWMSTSLGTRPCSWPKASPKQCCVSWLKLREET